MDGRIGVHVEDLHDLAVVDVVLAAGEAQVEGALALAAAVVVHIHGKPVDDAFIGHARGEVLRQEIIGIYYIADVPSEIADVVGLAGAVDLGNGPPVLVESGTGDGDDRLLSLTEVLVVEGAGDVDGPVVEAEGVEVGVSPVR